MAKFIQETFSVNLSLLRFFGLYGHNKRTKLYKLKAWILYAILGLPTPIFGFLHIILQESLTIGEEVYNIFIIVELGRCSVKLLPFLINGTEIKKCILYLESHKFQKFYQNENMEIFETSQNVFQKITKVYMLLCALGTSFWCTKPILLHENGFPQAIWIPFEETSIGKFYIPIYVFMSIGVAYTVAVVSASDPLTIGLAYQATNHLKLLKSKLNNLSQFAEQAIKDVQCPIRKKLSQKNIIIYERIKHCIDHHSAIIEFVDYYETTFSTILFSQFVASSFVICLACFQLTMSNALSTAIYMGNWLEYDLKSKKALLLLMERSKRPMVIRAGKLIDFSIHTFTSIIRKSYSLLTLLNNYNNARK